LLGVKAPNVVEVFRQPKQIEVPRGVTEKFRQNQAPNLDEREQPEPGHGGGCFARFRKYLGDLRALGSREAGMSGRGVVIVRPPDCPEQACCSGGEEDPSPAGGSDNRRDGGRRNDRSYGSARIDN